MVVSLPIRVQFLVDADKFFQERIAFTVRASGVFQRKRSELQVKFAHPLKQRKVLYIESLDAVGQRVVVGTFAARLLVGFGGEGYVFGYDCSHFMGGETKCTKLG